MKKILLIVYALIVIQGLISCNKPRRGTSEGFAGHRIVFGAKYSLAQDPQGKYPILAYLIKFGDELFRVFGLEDPLGSPIQPITLKVENESVFGYDGGVFRSVPDAESPAAIPVDYCYLNEEGLGAFIMISTDGNNTYSFYAKPSEGSVYPTQGHVDHTSGPLQTDIYTMYVGTTLLRLTAPAEAYMACKLVVSLDPDSVSPPPPLVYDLTLLTNKIPKL